MSAARLSLPRTAALLIIDVQKAIDDLRWGPRNNPCAEANISALLASWRRTRRPIYHVRHDSIYPTSPYRPGQPGNDFKPDVAPLSGEIVLVKRTNSAFIGTDLAARLVAAGHSPLVVAGVLTNNSVEATVRMAGNLGFETFVVSDATWAVDVTDLRGRRWSAEDVHALSLANMNDEYARVVDTATVLTACGVAAGVL
jgi:nicotinamidase-related amidase